MNSRPSVYWIVCSVLAGFLLGGTAGWSQTPQPIQSGLDRVAFESDAEGSEQIYVMEADGSNVVRLTNTPGANSHPMFSPDGRKIVFDSNRDGKSQIYVMDADGSNVTRLTSPPGASMFPRFSPDGNRIAFTSTRDAPSGDSRTAGQIYVMNINGSNVVRLTSPPGASIAPRFSPDGRNIVFLSDRGGTIQIYVMNTDGSNASPLTSARGVYSGPGWSPDGRAIAFSAKLDRGYQIYMMGADGSHITRLTNLPGESLDPVYSPDGRKILFFSGQGETRQIHQMNADGTNVTRLTNLPGVSADPAFGPPGPRLPPSAPLMHPAAFCRADSTIAPGIGVGRLSLGMNLTDVTAFLAPPPLPVEKVTSGDSTWENYYYYPTSDLSIVARDNRVVSIGLGSGTQDTYRCATRESIHVGGSTGPIKAAYGEPQGVFSMRNTNVSWWIYDKRGLILWVNTQGQVLSLDVFAPGTYCRLQESLAKIHEMLGAGLGPSCSDFKPPLSLTQPDGAL